MNSIDIIMIVAVFSLSIITNNKAATISSLFIISYILLEDLFNFEYITTIAISLNLCLLLALFHNGKSSVNHNDVYREVISNNKKLFPFHDNIEIAITKHPYTWIYLKEGKVKRIRTPLKNIIILNDYLKKITRNTAISDNVKVNRNNEYLIENNIITSEMIMSWGKIR